MTAVRRVAIQEVVSEPSIWNPRTSSSSEFIRYIDISSINAAEKSFSDVTAIVAANAPSRARQIVKSGDVLVSTVRPNLNAVAIVPPDLDGATASTGFAVLRPDPARLDARYLFHWVRSTGFVRHLTARARGASYPAVTERVVRESRMPLPGVDEQRRIAATLDRADAIRHKQRERLCLLDELLRSAFVQIFGDPVKNEKGWKVVRLGDQLSFLTSGSRGWSRYYSKSGRPFLRIQNVGQNRLILNDLAFVDPPSGAETERTAVRAGDVLLSITADLGRTAVVVPDLEGGHINQHLALLRTRDFNSFYLAQFLASEGGRRQLQNRNRQAVKAGLNFDDIRSLLIPVPPSELQVNFAMIYRRIEVTTTALEKASDAAGQLFDSIAHSKFGGDPR